MGSGGKNLALLSRGNFSHVPVEVALPFVQITISTCSILICADLHFIVGRLARLSHRDQVLISMEYKISQEVRRMHMAFVTATDRRVRSPSWTEDR
jgi:hypothetical protein